MKSVAVLLALQGLPIVLALVVFIYRRARWKRGKRPGFYPTTFALGVAFQQIQLFVAPNMEYTIAEQLKEEAQEDDHGGPDDPRTHLEHQLRQIRRGEPLDKLTTLLQKRD